jgi:hypothetical protein
MLLLVFLFADVTLYAQTEKTETFGVHVAPAFSIYEIHDGFKKERASGLDFGIEYSKKWKKRWTLGTGIDFITNYDFDTPVISLPLLFRYNFNKYIYADMGPSLFVSLSEDTVPLYLGGKIGLGFEYGFNNGLVLSLNPHARLIYIFPVIAGVSLGVGYRF